MFLLVRINNLGRYAVFGVLSILDISPISLPFSGHHIPSYTCVSLVLRLSLIKTCHTLLCNCLTTGPIQTSGRV